ncbi:MAG: hypothetical protein BWY72_01800 [Bacteroidetes bacterium ADurb.Bin416]|nr:MAG: hypothetical protein BWY72_01800 [Bacteroidetes bacterium ADurb.Bin416]
MDRESNGVRQGIIQVVKTDLHRFGLWVGENTGDRLLFIRYRVEGALGRIDRGWDIGKQGFDFGFNLVDINVTNHQNCLQVGPVPFFIIITQGFITEVVDDGGVADDVSFGVLGTGHHQFVRGFPQATGGCLALTPFFPDHAAFFVNLIVFKQDKAGPVMQDEQG